MLFIVGVSGGDAREQILVVLARQQVTVAKRVLAELGKELIAAVVGLGRELRFIDALGGACGGGADVVARYFRAGRKVHLASPSFGPLEDRLFPNCSTRSHADILASFGGWRCFFAV